MNRNWSDQDIVAHAPTVAAEIIAAAAKARNEAELRINVNPILLRFARAIGLAYLLTGTLVLIKHLVHQAELKVREKLLELELRLIEMGEKLEKAP